MDQKPATLHGGAPRVRLRRARAGGDEGLVFEPGKTTSRVEEQGKKRYFAC